ncbi:MAG: glycosyltransferase family 4 protein [Planctomycetaceae bacterium]|nr:glycosyltransferase family 4 protein [Planctomycetaceae bacterium]
MKILLVSASSGSRGGGEFYFLALATGLVELGHDVHIAMSKHSNMDEFAESISQICPVLRWPIRNTYHRHLRTLSAVRDAKSQKQLATLMTNFSPDIIHINKQNLEDGLDILYAAMMTTIPVSATVHVTRSMRELKAAGGWIRDIIARKAFSQTQIPLIATSPQCTHDLREFLGKKDSPQVYNVTNGAFPAEGQRETIRAEWGVDQNTIVLGTVARIEHQKNPLFLCSVLSKLPEHVHLVWVGDGSERTILEHEIAKYNLEGRVHLDGWRDDARQRMSGFDVFVLPSIYEGFPFAILEAMSASLPCVVSLVDGTKDAISTGETGYLLPVNDKDAWTETLKSLVKNPNKRQTIGKNARQSYHNQFSLQAMAERTVAVYENVISKHKEKA